MEAGFRVLVEIDVWIEILSMTVFMRTATEIMGVIAQVLDAGEPAEPVQEFTGLNRTVEALIGFAKLAQLLMDAFGAHLAVLVHGLLVIEGREGVQEFV